MDEHTRLLQGGSGVGASAAVLIAIFYALFLKHRSSKNIAIRSILLTSMSTGCLFIITVIVALQPLFAISDWGLIVNFAVVNTFAELQFFLFGVKVMRYIALDKLQRARASSITRAQRPARIKPAVGRATGSYMQRVMQRIVAWFDNPETWHRLARTRLRRIIAFGTAAAIGWGVFIIILAVSIGPVTLTDSPMLTLFILNVALIVVSAAFCMIIVPLAVSLTKNFDDVYQMRRELIWVIGLTISGIVAIGTIVLATFTSLKTSSWNPYGVLQGDVFSVCCIVMAYATLVVPVLQARRISRQQQDMTRKPVSFIFQLQRGEGSKGAKTLPHMEARAPTPLRSATLLDDGTAGRATSVEHPRAAAGAFDEIVMENTDTCFNRIMHSAKAYMAFVDFSRKAFASENLLFLSEWEQWTETYLEYDPLPHEDGAPRRRLQPPLRSHGLAALRRFVAEFLEDNSPSWVNVPAHIYANVKGQMTGLSEEEGELDLDPFLQAYRAVHRNVRDDLFLRFVLDVRSKGA